MLEKETNGRLFSAYCVKCDCEVEQIGILDAEKEVETQAQAGYISKDAVSEMIRAVREDKFPALVRCPKCGISAKVGIAIWPAMFTPGISGYLFKPVCHTGRLFFKT